jgi:hypothetical protein
MGVFHGSTALCFQSFAFNPAVNSEVVTRPAQRSLAAMTWRMYSASEKITNREGHEFP